VSPQETPHTGVHGERGVALRRYGGDAASGPVVLIVPAPIKRPYIWDLAPEVSVVRRCLAAGVIDAHCAVVPPDTVLPVFEAAGSGDKTLLHYEREPGVSLQHVGPLAGPRAHASLWPRIARWMQAH